MKFIKTDHTAYMNLIKFIEFMYMPKKYRYMNLIKFIEFMYMYCKCNVYIINVVSIQNTGINV